MTRIEKRILRLLADGWSLWSPHKARTAYLVPNDGTCRQEIVRRSTLDRMEDSGLIAQHVGRGEFPDVHWKLPSSVEDAA